MDKQELVIGLRQRAYMYGSYYNVTNAKKIVDTYSDEELLLLYATCEVCMEMVISYRWLLTAIMIAENVEDFLSLTDVSHDHEQDQLNPSEYEVVYPEPKVYEEDKFSFLEITPNPLSDRDDGEIEYALELGQNEEWHFTDEHDPINWKSNIHEIDE